MPLDQRHSPSIQGAPECSFPQSTLKHCVRSSESRCHEIGHNDVVCHTLTSINAPKNGCFSRRMKRPRLSGDHSVAISILVTRLFKALLSFSFTSSVQNDDDAREARVGRTTRRRTGRRGRSAAAAVAPSPERTRHRRAARSSRGPRRSRPTSRRRRRKSSRMTSNSGCVRVELSALLFG